MFQNFKIKINVMIMYCSIILKKCLESGILNTITTPVY